MSQFPIQIVLHVNLENKNLKLVTSATKSLDITFFFIIHVQKKIRLIFKLV